MKLQNSPSLEEASNALRGNIPPKKNKGLRLALVIVGGMILILLGISLVQNDLLTIFTSNQGIISGVAVNEAGEPVPVDVLVFGTEILAHSDAMGRFVVNNVPTGEQSVIVAYGKIATEVNVVVQANVETSLSTVTVPTSLLEVIDE